MLHQRLPADGQPSWSSFFLFSCILQILSQYYYFFLFS